MWLACLVSATQLSTDAADLMWSAQPLSEAAAAAELEEEAADRAEAAEAEAAVRRRCSTRSSWRRT